MRENIGIKDRYYLIGAIKLLVGSSLSGMIFTIITTVVIIFPDSLKIELWGYLLIVFFFSLFTIYSICRGIYIIRLPKVLMILDGQFLELVKRQVRIDLNDVLGVESREARFPRMGKLFDLGDILVTNSGETLREAIRLSCGTLIIHMENNKIIKQRFLADVKTVEEIINQKLNSLGPKVG